MEVNAKNIAAQLSPGNRSLSLDSSESDIMPHNTESETSIQDIANMLNEFKTEINQKIDGLKSDLTKVKQAQQSSIGKAKQDLLKAVKEVDDKLSGVVTQFNQKYNDLEARVSHLEEVQFSPAGFSYDTTVVVAGLRFTDSEDLDQICDDLVHNEDGLNIPDGDVTIIRTIRKPNRNNRSGLVKIQVSSVEEKINLLRSKQRLQYSDNPSYRNLYIRSSKSHEQRLIEQHTQTILNLMGERQNFRFTGSGRLVNRDAPPPRPQGRRGSVNSDGSANERRNGFDNNEGGRGRGGYRGRGGHRGGGRGTGNRH